MDTISAAKALMDTLSAAKRKWVGIKKIWTMDRRGISSQPLDKNFPML